MLTRTDNTYWLRAAVCRTNDQQQHCCLCHPETLTPPQISFFIFRRKSQSRTFSCRESRGHAEARSFKLQALYAALSLDHPTASERPFLDRCPQTVRIRYCTVYEDYYGRHMDTPPTHHWRWHFKFPTITTDPPPGNHVRYCCMSLLSDRSTQSPSEEKRRQILPRTHKRHVSGIRRPLTHGWSIKFYGNDLAK